jgi:hypothetical protein
MSDRREALKTKETTDHNAGASIAAEVQLSVYLAGRAACWTDRTDVGDCCALWVLELL